MQSSRALRLTAKARPMSPRITTSIWPTSLCRHSWETDDSPCVNPDGDTTLTPREWDLKNDPLVWIYPGGAHEGEPEYIELAATLMKEASTKVPWSRQSLTDSGSKSDRVGLTDEDGPSDMSEHHDMHRTEALAEAKGEDDPIVSGIDPRFAGKSDEWLLKNHPLLKFAGLFEDREGKTDIAENHDKYLAEAYADLHEE